MHGTAMRTILILAMSSALVGCDNRPQGSTSKVAYVTKSVPISFAFPADWGLNTKDHPYDLQCLSRSEDMTTGVFAFRSDEIDADATPIEIFWRQIEDIRSKRQSFTELESIQKHETEDKLITTITYLGERNNSKYCYRFALIEFKNDSSLFAVVLQVGLPEQWSSSKPILTPILESARPHNEK